MRKPGARLASTIALPLLLLVGCGDGSDSGGGTSSGGEPTGPPAASEQAAEVFAGIEDGDPFCSAAVLDDTEVVYAAAYGEDADGPVTVDTEVDIASVSKQFTGVAVELLIADGELAGDDLVGDLVPASSPATDRTTVDELLTHTSGIEDYGDLLDEDLDETTTQEDAIAAIATSEPTGSRGRYEYSNSNYVLLAEVVEAVAGTPLPEFLHDEVFAPLELDMAVDPRGAWKQVGDGSIWTTPTELVTWSTQYWDQTLDGPDLVDAMFDPATVELDEAEPTGGAYGSGLVRTTTPDGAELIGHDGSWDGYETDWAVIPDERLAAAVTCDEEAPLESDHPAEDLLELWR